MWMTKNQKLLPSAFQKLADQRGSPKRVRKLPRPTKAALPSTLRKSARFSVREERDDHDGGVDDAPPGRGTPGCASGTVRAVVGSHRRGRPVAGESSAPAPHGRAGPASVRLTSADRTSCEAVLKPLRGGLGRLGAADDVGDGVPGLVLEVRRAARQDLVGRADGRLAGLAPGDELLRQRILERHRPRSTAGRSPAARWRRARRTPASRPTRGRSGRRRRSARRRSARCAMSTWSEM